MKTHSGAKKRFKTTAKGKVRGRHAFSSHILEKKSPKRKRGFRKAAEINVHDVPRVKKMLGSGARRATSPVKSAGRMPAGGDSK